jgi:hypothetical protein
MTVYRSPIWEPTIAPAVHQDRSMSSRRQPPMLRRRWRFCEKTSVGPRRASRARMSRRFSAMSASRTRDRFEMRTFRSSSLADCRW